MSRWTIIGIMIMALFLAACDELEIDSSGSSNSGNASSCTGECGVVTRVIGKSVV